MAKFDYTRALLAGVHGSGRGVLVHRALLLILGSDAAIIMSQILYWSETKNGGWFYKSDTEWQHELGMSRHVIRRCVHGSKDAPNKIALIDFGVDVDVRKANNVPTTYYRVNKAKLERSLASYHDLFVKHGFIQPADPVKESTQSIVGNPDNACTESTQSIVGNPDNPLTKSTAKNTTDAAPGKPPRVPDEKQPTQQQMLVGALFDAFDITAPTGPDRTKAGKVAKELAAVGIAAEDVPDLVAFVRRQAAGQWTVTMMSLIGNGRVSQYLQAKERTEQAVTMVTEDDWNPAAHIGTPDEIEAGRLRVEGNKLLAQGILPNPNWRDRLPDYMRDND